MTTYAADVERLMVHLYQSLSEKDRRRYAAVEAEKLGHGGVAYVAGLFGCDADTIRQGQRDIFGFSSRRHKSDTTWATQCPFHCHTVALRIW